MLAILLGGAAAVQFVSAGCEGGCRIADGPCPGDGGGGGQELAQQQQFTTTPINITTTPLAESAHMSLIMLLTGRRDSPQQVSLLIEDRLGGGALEQPKPHPRPTPSPSPTADAGQEARAILSIFSPASSSASASIAAAGWCKGRLCGDPRGWRGRSRARKLTYTHGGGEQEGGQETSGGIDSSYLLS